MNLEQIKALAAQAAQTEDQTETKGGNFEYEVPPAGVAAARFVEYIELGKQQQRPYMGKPKPDAEEVRLTFELLAPASKHVKEIEVDGVKRQIANRVGFKISKKLGEKAAFKHLFNKMRYGRDGIVHMAQMLGEAFIVTVVHNTVKGAEGRPDRTYVNLRTPEGEWQVQAPFRVDPMTDESTPIRVPEPIGDVRIFLFDNPTKESWEALFIDGSRTVKDDKGNEKEVSKNWLQETILGATNFEGSALQQMLGGLGNLPGAEPADPLAADTPPAPEKSPEKPAEAPKAAKPTAEPKPAPRQAEAAQDDLAALGL